jgi:hypothetical protein
MGNECNRHKFIGKSTPRVNGLKGEIDTVGNLRCFAQWELGWGNKHNPSHFIGRIDHYGDFCLEAAELNSSFGPLAELCVVWKYICR